LNSSNPDWPWLSLTEWGEAYVSEAGADVYDPDGYLRKLASDRPLDDIERRYLSQAAAALRADLPDATAVMLGAASEHLLLLLGDAVAAADSTGATKVKKALPGPALTLLEKIRKYLDPPTIEARACPGGESRDNLRRGREFDSNLAK
jgi:hypothetical protein